MNSENDMEPTTPVPKQVPVPASEDDHAVLLDDKEIDHDDEEMEDPHEPVK